MSLDDSIRAADKLWVEERADLLADRQRRGGYIVNDRRKVGDEYRQMSNL
jgi:hypothetical protein